MSIDSRENQMEKTHNYGMASRFPIHEIPTHIIFDILLRLPIKTLVDCRRVCKEWLSLISNPHFANLHLSRSQISLLVKPITSHKPKSRKLDLVEVHITPPTPTLNFREKFVSRINLPENASEVVNSCNGLLCLYESGTKGPVYVCNPISGEYISLPEWPSGTNWSHRSAAFGFSPATNQYKVARSFCFQMSRHRFGWETEIYTLGEGSWRNIGKYPVGIENSSFDAFLNGALHWIPDDPRIEDLICCFDFGSEQFGVVPEPSKFGPCEKDFLQCICLGGLQGCLSICDMRGYDTKIWVMKDYGVKESWSKDYVIESRTGVGVHLSYYEPIMILESGQILMLCDDESLLIYDPELKCDKDVYTYGKGSEFRGIAHVPSLISLRDVAKGENLKRLNCSSFGGTEAFFFSVRMLV